MVSAYRKHWYEHGVGVGVRRVFQEQMEESIPRDQEKHVVQDPQRSRRDSINVPDWLLFVLQRRPEQIFRRRTTVRGTY